ncbi:slowpoke binding protein isoform X1 [Haemaphysalis longicornis]
MAFRWDDFAREYYWVILLAIFALMALAAIAVWAILRCRYPRHEYLALDNESSFVSDRLELSRKLRGDIDRNEALINCQYYLRGSTRYFLRYQLCNIGSRMDRHWFVVRDSATRTERLLTVTALPDACPLRHSPCQVRPGLLEIFLGLQHPYVHPVLDIDIKVLAERPHVVVVSPLNDVGSLKDLIYHVQRGLAGEVPSAGDGPAGAAGAAAGQADSRGPALPPREGLPGLLQPPPGQRHPAERRRQAPCALSQCLHTGPPRPACWALAEGGRCTANAAGLGCTGRGECHEVPLLDPGHALFEMAAGYEMSTTKPTDKNYNDVEHCPEVYQVLRFIFESGNHHYPTLEEVAMLDFFRNIDLRELTTHTVPPILRTTLSSTARHLLRDVQRFYRNKGKLKTSRSISESSCDGGQSSESDKTDLLLRSIRGQRRPSPSSGPLTLQKPCPPRSSELLTPPPGSSPPPEFSSSPPQADTPPLPPEVPPRPPLWVQSQSSVSTCGSVDYCTPPSSPHTDSPWADS